MPIIAPVPLKQKMCPTGSCAYWGWAALGNLRANGHPNGGPWRQFHCSACGAYVLETHGTPLHGKRVAPDGSSPHHFRGCCEKARGYNDFSCKM